MTMNKEHLMRGTISIFLFKRVPFISRYFELKSKQQLSVGTTETKRNLWMIEISFIFLPLNVICIL